MADTTREVEHKYVFPGEAQGDGPPALPDLTGVAGVTAVRAEGITELDAVYHDTSDLRLAAGHVTLRRREGGHDEGWHLKFPVGPGVRDELRAPLSDHLPDDLARLVRSRTRGADVAPVVRLRTSRAITRLLGKGGAPLVEMAVDAVRAERLGAGAGAGPAVSTWTEVEAELEPGADPAVLDKVDRKLRKAGLAPAPSASKLARALAETGPPAPEARQERGPSTAGDHLLAYLREQAEAIAALDPAVRRDLPDSVHQLRVAVRRLRSALRSYGRILDRAVTDPLGGELRWLGAELGVDRDNEVLAAHLRARVDAVPAPLLLGPVEARLRRWTAASGSRSRELTLATLDSDRYLALLDSLAALLADPPLRGAAGATPRTALPKAVLKEYGKLARRVAYALDLPAGKERDLALHSARKAAKRVRYAAEAAAPGAGRPAKVFARRMKKVQQLLGEHQDGVVAREAVRDLAIQAHAGGETAFTWGLLYAGEDERARAAERALPRVWAKASRPAARAALKR
ncbi:CYTH and CHAD domain-containing protein [Streptomyces sp. NBC_01497]|uniref:CYTH and CHAD domain-containing protein n=1 Tax=Streptomyces sp. NBC_01497 TaxID=2903885 RepID=UPI002E3362CB|nr:CYTH and CHAD domain-containing protein [Streptomyces sp. NBC_01497]